MNLIKFLKEYKSYKRRSGYSALISQKSKKKNKKVEKTLDKHQPGGGSLYVQLKSEDLRKL